jgi:hypothetical protein
VSPLFVTQLIQALESVPTIIARLEAARTAL